jgi:hypothetical protein
MQRVIADDDWQRLLRRGAVEVARPFTWQRCARQTYRVYCGALGKHQAAPLAA